MSSRNCVFAVVLLVACCWFVGCGKNSRDYVMRFEPYCHSTSTVVLTTEPEPIEGCPGFKFARYERNDDIKVKVLIAASEDVHKGDSVTTTTVVMSEAEVGHPTLELTRIRIATKVVTEK